MTQEQIIKLAREAETGLDCFHSYAEFLERFAALVAAAERESCAHAAEVAISLMCDPVKSIRARGQS